MRITRRLFPAVLSLLAITSAMAQAAPPVIQIEDHERVVHVTGTPFNHAYYGDWLETFLLQRYAHRGLIFRSVNRRSYSADGLARDLDTLVLIHKPTLVILQCGNDDLDKQYRSEKYDFAEALYARPMEIIVQKLRAAGIKVVLCSVIPRGTDGPKGRFNPPNDGLKVWVDQARKIADSHGVVFVDIFTDAIDWPMINKPQNSYGADMHKKSWELMSKQVRFEPAGSNVTIDAKSGRTQCQGATVTDLQTGGGVSFTLQNAAGAGMVTLKIANLPANNHVVTVNGKPFARKTAEELATGIDVGLALHTLVGTKEYKQELVRGHEAVASLSEIQKYKLPAWVEVADFQQQKQAATAASLIAIKAHDAAMRELVTPQPLAIRIAP